MFVVAQFACSGVSDDGSCLYITQCNIPEQYYGNTGNNMIIGFLPAAINSLPITNDDAYIVAFSHLEMLIGSIQMDAFDGTMAVWGDDNYFNGRSMDVYIAKLRKYLKGDPSVKIINVHGRGFKLLT